MALMHVQSVFVSGLAKNRLPIMQEHLTRATVNRQVDPAKAMLKAYVGLAEGDKEKSIKTDTESLALYFSGYYSKRPRNAAGLSKIISRVLGCQVTLQQFYGRWFDLEPEQRNTIGCKNATLGKDFVIGSSVFEGSCSIRIQTAPVSLADFKVCNRASQSSSFSKSLLTSMWVKII